MQHHGTVSNARQAEANEVQEEAAKQLGGGPCAASGFPCSGQPTGLELAAAHSLSHFLSATATSSCSSFLAHIQMQTAVL